MRALLPAAAFAVGAVAAWFLLDLVFGRPTLSLGLRYADVFACSMGGFLVGRGAK